MALLVKNCEIVTATDRYVADIYCADQTITRIEPNIPPPPGTEIVDARGK
jgi:dihydroorotase-like cyclic amidohydrolase